MSRVGQIRKFIERSKTRKTDFFTESVKKFSKNLDIIG